MRYLKDTFLMGIVVCITACVSTAQQVSSPNDSRREQVQGLVVSGKNLIKTSDGAVAVVGVDNRSDGVLYIAIPYDVADRQLSLIDNDGNQYRWRSGTGVPIHRMQPQFREGFQPHQWIAIDPGTGFEAAMEFEFKSRYPKPEHGNTFSFNIKYSQLDRSTNRIREYQKSLQLTPPTDVTTGREQSPGTSVEAPPATSPTSSVQPSETRSKALLAATQIMPMARGGVTVMATITNPTDKLFYVAIPWTRDNANTRLFDDAGNKYELHSGSGMPEHRLYYNEGFSPSGWVAVDPGGEVEFPFEFDARHQTGEPTFGKNYTLSVKYSILGQDRKSIRDYQQTLRIQMPAR